MTAPHAWYVTLDFSGAIASVDPDQAMDKLAKSRVTMTEGPGRLGFSLVVKAASPIAAASKGATLIQKTLRQPGDLEAVEVVSVEDGDKALEQRNYPDLVGVSEVAELLGVSRQRVSELAKVDYFPKPLAHLKSGPVWDRVSLTHFLEDWDRSPRRKAGRPRKTAAADSREPSRHMTMAARADVHRASAGYRDRADLP